MSVAVIHYVGAREENEFTKRQIESIHGVIQNGNSSTSTCSFLTQFPRGE